MRPIPQTYNQAGYHMTLIRRDGNVAMYQDAGNSYWEVHRVRFRKAEKLFDKDLPDREALAGDGDFGKYGWACVTQEQADQWFANALATEKSKEITP